MYHKNTPEKPTTERFLSTVIERQACVKHNVPEGIPCWHITRGSGGFGFLAGVCDKRAQRAGFSHDISEKSLRLNRHPKKR